MIAGDSANADCFAVVVAVGDVNLAKNVNVEESNLVVFVVVFGGYLLYYYLSLADCTVVSGDVDVAVGAAADLSAAVSIDLYDSLSN